MSALRWSRRSLLGSACLGLAAAHAEEPLRVRYPRMGERPTQAYGYQMLAAALQRSGVPFELSVPDTPVSGKVALRQLELGELQVLDLGLTIRSLTRFDVLLRPLDMGLSGVRLLLGKPQALERLRQQPTLEGLRQLTVGQGLGWRDARLLREAGVRVEESPFARLLPMLQFGRFDLCALGAEEAHRVLREHAEQAPDVAISDALALHMPFVRLFFVHRGEERLRQALAQGLDRLWAGGEGRELLARHSGLGDTLRDRRPLPPLLPLPDSQLPPSFHTIPRAQFHPALRATLPRP